MKHTEIRQRVLDGLESAVGSGVAFFDGRPAVIEEDDFPAVAVYLTDAEYTGDELDADIWQATLHIEVFLPAQVPDSALDEWMENRVYPAIAHLDTLAEVVTMMIPEGFDYQRDDMLGLWSSADMKYSITYEM